MLARPVAVDELLLFQVTSHYVLLQESQHLHFLDACVDVVVIAAAPIYLRTAQALEVPLFRDLKFPCSRWFLSIAADGRVFRGYWGWHLSPS
jgi:hypothetical protein